MTISVTIPTVVSATGFEVAVSCDSDFAGTMTVNLDGASVDFSLDGAARKREHPVSVAADDRFQGRITNFGGTRGQTVVVKVATPEATSGNGTVT